MIKFYFLRCHRGPLLAQLPLPPGRQTPLITLDGGVYREPVSLFGAKGSPPGNVSFFFLTRVTFEPKNLSRLFVADHPTSLIPIRFGNSSLNV